MADPISWTTIGIAIVSSIGVGAAESVLTPHPRLPAVDKNRADDIRLMTSGEGVFIPIFKGWGRAAPNIIWSTKIIEHEHKTTVGGGGKGLGGGQTQPENDFTYTVTLCCAISAGPVWNGLRRIWNSTEVIFNLSGSNGGYYEAEDPANTRTGTTSVNPYDAASGRQELTLAPGASDQFNTVLSYGTRTRPLTIYFRTGAITSYKLYVNSVLIETFNLPNTGNTVFQTRTVNVPLNDGNNVIKIVNNSGTYNLGIDRIFVFPGFADTNQVTGIVSEGDFATVTPDPNAPQAYFDVAPTIDPGGGGGGTLGGGSGSGTLTGAGGAQFFFYLGKEDQPQDATMVAQDGAANVPAYREVFYVLIKDLQLVNNQMPNLTFEFDEGTHDLAQVMTQYYKQAGARDSEIDFSALAGTHFIGQVITQLQPLSQTIDPLQQWYNFDLLPIDGKITAIKRGGSMATSIPESKLACYEEGQEPPAGACTIDYIDPSALPREINISYQDVAKDYHNATELAARAVGLNESPQNLNFPVVAESDDATQVGLRLLYQNYIERPITFQTGPEFHYLSPTDPVTLALSNISHRVRITGKQAPPGGGLIRWKGVTENIGVYTQTLAPGLTGFEPLIVDYPANSVMVIIDAPLTGPDDANDGTHPAIQIAMCKRGTTRAWRGGVAFIEAVPNEWQRATNFLVDSSIGQARTTLATTSDVTVFDETHTFTVDFWNEVSFESYSEAEISAAPQTNLFWLGINGRQGEYVQAATITPVTPLTGYKSAFTFSKLLRGRFDTDYAIAHTSGEFLVLMDSTVKISRRNLAELKSLRRWVGASVGQGINEALIVSELDLTWQGLSITPRKILNLIVSKDGFNDWFIQFKGQPRASEEPPEYGVDICVVGTGAFKRTLNVLPTQAVAAMLFEMGAGYTYSDLYKPGKPPPTAPTTSYANQNNLIAPDAPTTYAYVKSIQAIEQTGVRIDVTTDVPRNSSGTELIDTSFSNVFGLIPADTVGTPPANSVIPFQVQWFAPQSPADPSDKYIRVFNYATKVYELLVNGMGSAANVRAGETFTLLLIGNECRAYRNYSDNAKPLVVMNLDFTMFPLRIFAGASGGSDMLNFMIRGLGTSTIYSARQQIEDFGSVQSQIRMKVYQKSKYAQIGKGIITDYTTP